MATAKYRKTRFVCVSDTHNQTPKLPRGDVLVHAGDLTNQGTLGELRRAVTWLESTDFEVKIVIAGNHDLTLDRDFYLDAGHRRHNQTPQDPVACLEVLTQSSSITYLNHEARTIQLQAANGPRTRFTIFGSPFSRRIGQWGFGYQDNGEARRLWNDIPTHTDIVVTHTPPRGHCDWSPGKGGLAGCEELRKALWRVRPKLHICGHCHEGRGAERMRWKSDERANDQCMEESCLVWTDVNRDTKKQSLIDLTANRGNIDRHVIATQKDEETQASELIDFQPCASQPNHKSSDVWTIKDTSRDLLKTQAVNDVTDAAECEATLRPIHGATGEGEAGAARLTRQETCIINAAIMGSGYQSGPKKFNKPIVVDIDLPIA